MIHNLAVLQDQEKVVVPGSVNPYSFAQQSVDILLTSAGHLRFDDFLRLSWAAIGRQPFLPDIAPDGIGEFLTDVDLVSYAVAREQQFAAFRWSEQEPGQAHADIYEIFFVKPETHPTKVGLRRISLEGARNLSITARELWDMLGLQMDARASYAPSFIELAVLLSSGGKVSTTSADTFAQLELVASERDYFKDLSHTLTNDVRRLQARVRDVETRSPVTQTDALAAPELPGLTDLLWLQEWAETNEHRILIHPRALAGAKKSNYANPTLIYQALELLAGAFRDNRLKLIDNETYQQALGELGLKFEGSVSPYEAGAQGDAYFVMHNGRRRFLDYHYKKGGARDQRYCLRIYFFWDEDSKRVVVGWLPSHLNNSLS